MLTSSEATDCEHLTQGKMDWSHQCMPSPSPLNVLQVTQNILLLLLLLLLLGWWCSNRHFHGYDLQFYDKCIWVKISTQNGRSVLTGNQCSPTPSHTHTHTITHNIKVAIIYKYFCSLEKTLTLNVTVFS